MTKIELKKSAKKHYCDICGKECIGIMKPMHFLQYNDYDHYDFYDKYLCIEHAAAIHDHIVRFEQWKIRLQHGYDLAHECSEELKILLQLIQKGFDNNDLNTIAEPLSEYFKIVVGNNVLLK